MKTLLTGSTGYIGRRLKRRLLQEPDVDLRLLVRNPAKVTPETRDLCQIVEGDTLRPDTLVEALSGVETAYYLIHSMASRRGDYAELDRTSAVNFRDACIKQGVKRIIYLGGLGKAETASKHLLSRLETGEILSARPEMVRTMWFRAAVIIGAGGASYEMIRHIVQKFPIIPAPRWVDTLTQPIAVTDIVEYLALAKDVVTEEDLIIDIGSEKMSFGDMLEQTAEAYGLKRSIIKVPGFTPAIASYGLALVTPINYTMGRALVEGLKSETIKQNDNASLYFPQIEPVSFKSAVRAAVLEMEQDLVISAFCDAGGGEICELPNPDNIQGAVYKDEVAIALDGIEPAEIFRQVYGIGGSNRWFTYDFLWIIRGWMDKLMGGPGLTRWRRCNTELRPGDVLDFWRVADVVPDKRLLLYAEFKLPGRGWLEFKAGSGRLIITAYFIPRGLQGRLYWYIYRPFHGLIFRDMARQLVARAAKWESGG